MSALLLRPHHALCLRFFRGKGYSPEFVANMTAIQAALTPEAPVELAGGADRVCAFCPNRRGELCEAQEKVARYDRAVLDRCGLAAGQILPFGTLEALAEARILAPGAREAVCGDCQWTELCR